jgi:hypothetical protein
MFSCKNNEEIFKGKIFIVENTPDIKTLTGKRIELNGIYTGTISVFDSVILFSSYKYEDVLKCNSLLFNLKTGEQINSLIKVGEGPGEFSSGSFQDIFFHNDTVISMWFSDYVDKQQCFLFDIINNKITDTFDISGLDSERERPHSRFFILSDSLLLAYSMPQKLFLDDNTMLPPSWRLYNYKTNEKCMQYDIYTDYKYFLFLPLSEDILKPDNTKLVLPMEYFRQINILNINTGELKGFKFNDSPDYMEVATTPYSELKRYYERACADDNFIYAAIQEENNTTVDVFDWDGNYVKKLILDKKMENKDSNIAIDPVNKYLYIIYVGEEEEEIYQYDVGFFYK